MNERDDIGSSASGLEGELFRLARSEVPSADSRRRTLVALGVGATVASAASLTEAAATVKAGALAGASAATGHLAKAVALTTALKWAAVGAVAGTAVLGGVSGVKQLTSHSAATTFDTNHERSESAAKVENLLPSPSSRVPNLQPQPLPPDPGPAIQPTNRAPLPREVRLSADTETAPVAEAHATEGSAGVADRASPLEEEVTRIDRARAALAGGAPTRALLELDQYDLRFPDGMMKPEATVVRIDAMAHSGNLEGAKTLGRRFLAAHPDGGLALRVHKVIGE
jgi:hypothetical protein